MVWNKCTKEERQTFEENSQNPDENNQDNGDQHELAPLNISMRIQWPQDTTMKGTGAAFPTRPAIRSISTFGDIPTIWIIWFDKTSNAVEV